MSDGKMVKGRKTGEPVKKVSKKRKVRTRKNVGRKKARTGRRRPTRKPVKKVAKKRVRRRPTIMKDTEEEERGGWASASGPMGFFDHMRVFKKHVIRMGLAVGFFTVICFSTGVRWFTINGYDFPYLYPSIEENIPTQLFLKMRHDLLPPDVQMVMLNPIDALLVNFQIALFMGIGLGMIVILVELGKFIGPALKKKEKKAILSFTMPALFLFFLGCAFSYYFITPFTLSFLYAFGQSMDVVKLIGISEFISFVTVLVLGMGFAFELPVVMYAVTLTGLVKPDFWKKHWRIATVIMIIIAGIITPDTTGITQIFVMFPLIGLYAAGYFASKRMYDKRHKAERDRYANLDV